jgi:AcrR family transcriptional regulator
MIRPRTIDRDLLLAVAEDIAGTLGIASVTFGEVASAAGVPKASVQSAFRTRENLLEAMLVRWVDQEHSRFADLAGASPTTAQAVAAHVKSTRNESAEAMQRMASLVAALKETNAGLSQIDPWYRSRGLVLEASCPDEVELRTAFLAAEGAFFVRYLVGLGFSEAAWNSTFDELTGRIEKLLQESKAP